MCFKYMIQALVRGSSVLLLQFRVPIASRILRVFRCSLAVIAIGGIALRAVAADAPSQVAILSKAGPIDPLSLTIEPSALPTRRTGEPKTLSILGKIVAPGTTDVLYWSPGVSFDGNSIPRGVLVANGTRLGTHAVSHRGRAR